MDLSRCPFCFCCYCCFGRLWFVDACNSCYAFWWSLFNCIVLVAFMKMGSWSVYTTSWVGDFGCRCGE